MEDFNNISLILPERGKVKSLSLKNDKKIRNKGAQIVLIGIPIICRLSLVLNLINMLSKTQISAPQTFAFFLLRLN